MTSRVPAERLIEAGAGLFRSAGVPTDDARYVAETLVQADLRGHFSHGSNQIPGYLEVLDKGDVRAQGEIAVQTRGAGFATIDGGFALGQIASKVAMETAIELARESAVGAVNVNRSAHFGAGAYWAQMAADADMIGFATSNDAVTTVAAHGSIQPGLVNAAFCWAIPAGEEPDIVIDMGTGAAADGKLKLAELLGEKIPVGWATDAGGQPTSDPDSVMAILPFGGPKGYAINILCDVLTGILGRADASTVSVGRPVAEGGWMNHFFLALNISTFLPLPEFKAAVDRQSRALRKLGRAKGVDRIYTPGERSGESRERALREGIRMPAAILARLAGVGRDREIDSPWVREWADLAT